MKMNKLGKLSINLATPALAVAYAYTHHTVFLFLIGTASTLTSCALLISLFMLGVIKMLEHKNADLQLALNESYLIYKAGSSALKTLTFLSWFGVLYFLFSWEAYITFTLYLISVLLILSIMSVFESGYKSLVKTAETKYESVDEVIAKLKARRDEERQNKRN